METWQRAIGAIQGESTATTQLGDVSIASTYGDLDAEYKAVTEGAALCDRSYRALLELTGKDRAGWLHNLTTNHVKTLAPGDGVYAFVLNIKGRILFDLNVLVLSDIIRLDLDRRFLDVAMQHFGKYTIVEDVSLIDRSADCARVSLVGPAARDVIAKLSHENLAAAPLLQWRDITLGGVTAAVFRHTAYGVDAIDIVVPLTQAEQAIDAIKSVDGVRPAGFRAVDTARIEAGVPWPVSEINDELRPAESGCLESAVSFNKGCYLGQEIVERMRSRGSVARTLTLLKCDGSETPAPQARIIAGESDVGRVTSSARSPRHGNPLVMGFVKQPHGQVGAAMKIEWQGGNCDAEVIPRRT